MPPQMPGLSPAAADLGVTGGLTPKQLRDRRRYWSDPLKARTQRKARYWKDPEKSRQVTREGKRKEYWANPEKAREYKKKCSAKTGREILTERNRLWRKNNPEKARAGEARRDKEKNAEAALKKRYGISRAQWNEMRAQQDNKCALCSEEFGIVRKHIHIDHCHKTGKVRKLLCNLCNTMLGRARDNPEILRRGAAYIDEWSAKHAEVV